jgi:hypothetical protein
MKNKIYVKCLVDNNPYTFDFETETKFINAKALEFACVDEIMSEVGDNTTKSKIAVIWANLINKKPPSTKQGEYNIYFRNKYIYSIKNQEIENLKNELGKQKDIDKIDLILNDIIILKEKLFNEFLLKMNFGHEGY